ncbi:MAG: serine hydrolase domain-containing protein [Chloroflexota bacterium]
MLKFILLLIFLALLVVFPISLWRLPLRTLYWPTAGWKTAPPETQGLSSARLAAGLQGLRARQLPIDSLLLIRNGEMVLEACFAPYDCDQVHNLASITKSVMTTLIAIAADQGKLDLDQPVLSFFADQPVANLDARKEHLTVRHLASMTAGFESQCLAGDQANVDAMQASPNWAQFALDRPMVAEPGSQFCYDSPAMHLLSAALRRASGQTTQDFARQNLFEPLGIQTFIWNTDPQGNALGAGELYLKPRDLAKLGYLWLNGGVWEGRQIVPAAWVPEAVRAQTTTGGDDGYGYGWWVPDGGYAAIGRGGQNLRVIPALNALVVVTGSGVDFDEVETAVLKPALTAFGFPLPPDPAGVAALQQTLDALAQPDPAWINRALPSVATDISGRSYQLQPNPQNLSTLSLEFADTTHATFQFQRAGSDQVFDWLVGLDGHYRINVEGHGLRGRWLDAQTFEIEIFDIGRASSQLCFDAESVTVRLPAAGVSFDGNIKE